MMRRLAVMLGALPAVAGAQGRPCGLGPAGTTWMLVERSVAESKPTGGASLQRRWLERVAVTGTPAAWRVAVVRTPLEPGGRRDSVVVTPARRARAADARVEAPPCARLVSGATFRARVAEGRDTITWRVGSRLDTLGVQVVELLADREIADTAVAQQYVMHGDTTGVVRADTLRAGARLAGTESRRRIVRVGDGRLLLDVVERRLTGRLAGASALAGSATRTDRMDARPIAPATAALFRPAVLGGDSAVIATADDASGRAAWQRTGDTLRMRTRHADGWHHEQQAVFTADGALVHLDDVAPLVDPPVVRWQVRDGELVADAEAIRPVALPTDRPWGAATTGTLELLAPALARLAADTAWRPFAILVPSRRGVSRADVEVRIRPVHGHHVVHVRPPGVCALEATLLFTADWTPLTVNVGGPFGETRFPARGTRRGARLEAASRVVTQGDLYPTASLADQQAGRC